MLTVQKTLILETWRENFEKETITKTITRIGRGTNRHQISITKVEK